MALEIRERGGHGSFFPVVHSVRFVLAHCVAGSRDLPLRVAYNLTLTHFRRRGYRSARSTECALSVAGTIASRPARHLKTSLFFDYNYTVNDADFR